MSLKNLALYRKTKNIFEFSVKNYVRNTKKFTCDKNCVYQCNLHFFKNILLPAASSLTQKLGHCKAARESGCRKLLRLKQ
jgi:hypothetical protein